jgi:transglutaminase-like putative cysteine protease
MAALGGWVRNGRTTAAKTMSRMRDLVRADLPKPLIWEAARAIVGPVKERDQVNQANAIRKWCAERFKFTPDPLYVELTESPAYMLGVIGKRKIYQGDCDAAAVLSAALLEAVGIPAVTPKGPYEHVFTVATPRGGKPVEMDITRPAKYPELPNFPKLLPFKV